MKLTKTVIKQFECDQKAHGTKCALYNIIWSVAADIFKSLGIRHIETSEKAKR